MKDINDKYINLNINHNSILETEDNKSTTNEIEIFQEKVKKIFLEKEKNKLKNKSIKQILSDNSKKKNEKNAALSSNGLKNIQYETIKNDDTINTEKQPDNNIKQETIKSECKNNKENKKDERNKILLKLLVNKELSRISSISKELNIPNKKNNKQNNNNNNINNQEIIKEEKKIIENEENQNNNDKEDIHVNMKGIQTDNLDIVKNEEKITNNCIEENNNKPENKSIKKDALKIIELLKLKSNSLNKDNKDKNNPKEKNIEEEKKNINNNINTYQNKIQEKEIIKEENNKNEVNSKLILKKKNINNNILHRFINKKNCNNILDNNKITNTNTNINLYSFNHKDIVNYNNNQIINDMNDNIRYTYEPKNNFKKKLLQNEIKYNRNNNYNINEKILRKKLENDLAIEINKNEVSEEWIKDNNNLFYKKNDEEQNIKTQEIIFSKENINNEKYNNINSFDKNETIQFPLYDNKNNENKNKNKIYSKKNLILNINNVKSKTNFNFFNINKIPIDERRINTIYPKKNIHTNKNNISKKKNYNKNMKNKSFGANENKYENIIYNKKCSIYNNHSFELINQNNAKNLECKIIKYKKVNSSFDYKLHLHKQNSNNSINRIYIKKNLINNNGNNVEKKNRNKSVKYLNKYNIQNEVKDFSNNLENSNNYGISLLSPIYIKEINNKSIPNSSINNNNTSRKKILNNKNQNIIIYIIEELLVLEDKLNEIIISLNTEKSISNYCFEFWNYFYNSLLFSKLEIILKNFNDLNIIKLSFNLILFTIMICYDFSYESNKLINIYLFLSEILELNHKNLILILEHISNKIIFSNRENNWIIRAYNIINNFNLTEDNENYYNNNMNYSEIIIYKIKININILIQKINYILLTNKTNFNECLIRLFSKIKFESFIYIDDFFKEYLLRENFIECSVMALTYLKEKIIFEPENAPYIRGFNKKKFSLVLDLDETLISFKLNKENNDEGVLKLRPNLYNFLDNVMKYYEIILFTEASQSYIDLLINALEENKKYFEYKLYRQHTVIIGNDFIKDLTRIGRPLNSIIIIDNMPQNFKLQKGNGINIKSFWGDDDDEDNTLIDLMNILINIAKEEDDVRKGLIKYHEEIITKITSNIYKHNKF